MLAHQHVGTSACWHIGQLSLPPMYEVWREAMFSQVCVCPTFLEGYPIQLMGGYPSQVMAGRVTLSQVQAGGTPHPGLDGVPCPHLGWGTLWSRTGWGTPWSRTGWGTPLSHQETEQHSKHLLRDSWYASCVYAGGLSCSLLAIIALLAVQ